MHDEPPVSPSDSEEISPAPKARLRWLWRTLLGVALALLLALGAVAGLLASARDSAGLTRLVQVIEWGSGGRLTVAAAEGDLFSRWQLHDIRFESATTQLSLSRLELAWQPSALWQQRILRVDLLALGDCQVNMATGEVTRNGVAIDISRREWALLQALLQAHGRVLSAAQLHDSLYGLDQDVGSNTVNVHVHHLRKKLGADVIDTVRGLGFRLGARYCGGAA